MSAPTNYDDGILERCDSIEQEGCFGNRHRRRLSSRRSLKSQLAKKGPQTKLEAFCCFAQQALTSVPCWQKLEAFLVLYCKHWLGCLRLAVLVTAVHAAVAAGRDRSLGLGKLDNHGFEW